MSSQSPSAIELEFTRRYDQEHARVCLDERPTGLGRRLVLWRDEGLVRHALKVAGDPGLVLDVACGAGRFWPVLAEHANRVILATDNSQDMLDHARIHHPHELLKRVKTFQGSAFSIGLSANAVDCVFCLQLFQHVAGSDARMALLREFHRVTRDALIVLVRAEGGWLGGWSPSSWQHSRSERNQTCKACVETEFREAGFEVLGYQHFIPGCATSRVYVLRKQG